MLAKLQEKTGLTKKDSESFLAAFTELVSEEVVSNGREIRLIGFGSFKQKSSPARSVRIPKTGEMKDVPACKNLKFSASSTLKITE